MIADWTVEVGPDSPWIVVPWEGRQDLHWCWRSDEEFHAFKQADLLEEAAKYPELRVLLRMANGANTLTSKVDVFPIGKAELDPEIAENASEAETAFGFCSYLDCYTDQLNSFSHFEHFERVARETAAYLARQSLDLAGAEVVIRPARLYDEESFGWTLYAHALGASEQEARARWSLAAIKTVWSFQLAFATEYHQIGDRRRKSQTGE